MIERNVKILTSEYTVIVASLKVYDKKEQLNVLSVIELIFDDKDKIIEEDHHLYVAFKNLRKRLSDKKMLLLCKGCLIDVFPSGRQLITTRANRLQLGQPAIPTNAVDIFDDIENVSIIMDISVQEQFYKAWLSSLK